MAKFSKDDTDDFKKDEFEFDFEEKIDDYEERLDAFFDRADDYYNETPVKYLAEYDKAFKLASEYLTNKIKPFFDKHTELYGPMIYEIYDGFGKKICDRYNNFVMNFPDAKADFIADLKKENEYLQESKVLKQFIIENIVGQEVGQTAFANTCGKNKTDVLNTINELVDDGLLKRSKKGNAYHVSLVDGVNVDRLLQTIDKEISKNTDKIQEVKALNPQQKTYQQTPEAAAIKHAPPKRTLTPEEKKKVETFAIKTVLLMFGVGAATWWFVGFFAALLVSVAIFVASAFFSPAKK